MFCTSCGNKIDDNAKFCIHCGARRDISGPMQQNPLQAEWTQTPVQAAAPTVAPAAVKQEKRKGLPLGIVIGAAVVAVVIVLGIGASLVLNYLFSAERTIEKFTDAIAESDAEAFRSVAYSTVEGFELSDAALAPFFEPYSDFDDALDVICETLEGDAERLEDGKKAKGNDFVRLTRKNYLLFSIYRVEVTPLTVEVAGFYGDGTLTIADQSVPTVDGRVSVTLMPGSYSGSASCTAETGVALKMDFFDTLIFGGLGYIRGWDGRCDGGWLSYDPSSGLNITFDCRGAYLRGAEGLTLESVTIDGKAYSMSSDEFHRGVMITPLLDSSVIVVKASADGKTQEETFRCDMGDNFYMEYKTDSPDYLWNNAAAAVASANILGSTLRDAATNGWAGEWISLYYFDASDPTPELIRDRTRNIPLKTWLEQHVTYDGAAAAGWGDIWLSLMGTDGESELQQRFLYYINNCGSVYFQRSDIEGFDADMAALARNAPYAHAGRSFSDESIRSFFLQFDWYDPVIQPSAFTEGMLNACQTANKDLLVAYEHEMGYR